MSGHLARSLMTLKQTAKSVKIKLTKKDHPCLTVEIELVSYFVPRSYAYF